MPRLGSAILRYETVNSTNDVARDYALKGAPEGTVILAEQQTAGRGRLGRKWESPAGEGLYASIILRPHLKPFESAIITLASAVAVAETLALDFELVVDIKWPNDVLASGLKICGILVEAAIEGGAIQYVVTGVGVNLNQREMPEAIRETATSLFLEAGRHIAPEDFLKLLLVRFDHKYRAALETRDEILREWENLSTYARGRAVTITSFDETITGTTRGLTRHGGLILELDSGELREIITGEVSLRTGAS